MDLYLKGKTAVVTGASQGMGWAITKELAMEGVKVLAVARNEKLLNAELFRLLMAAGGITRFDGRHCGKICLILEVRLLFILNGLCGLTFNRMFYIRFRRGRQFTSKNNFL
jgi:NAD(P)-dependent dehydrogenase (short-subunit alcohol dehydrogenase family)